MNDKYIISYISKTKRKMLLYIQERLKDNHLSDLIPSHGNILTALYENQGKLTMKEISQIIGKDKSTITPLVNTLLTLGYISKEKDTFDKRISYIGLTEKGVKTEDIFNNISRDLSSKAYNGFSPEDKETFLKLLKKLNNNFN